MISVVIPAFNEEEHIGACLASLAAQETSQTFEVIVVDNASTDNTAAIARRYASRMNLRIVHEPRKGRGRARRTGYRVAKGDIFLSTDADIVLPPHWVETMSTTLRRKKAVGVVGDVQIADCHKFVNQAYNTLRPFIAVGFRLWYGHWLLNGGNSAYERWAYEAAGGFNATIDAQDDTEFSRRLSKIGKTRFVLNASITASGRRFRNGFLTGVSMYIRAFSRRIVLREELVRLEDVR